jgi:hypothetical protein
MPDPLFESRTARFDLPLLFAGQAQKEGFVNEIAARLDAMLHVAIEAEQAVPPVSPLDGQAWLIAASPSGEWTGKSGQIAARQAGNWFYFPALHGLRLFNRATGQFVQFTGTWAAPSRPPVPSGGTVIDVEVRAGLAAVVAALTTAGILAQP